MIRVRVLIALYHPRNWLVLRQVTIPIGLLLKKKGHGDGPIVTKGGSFNES
jgi:hypothetical protein